MSTLSGTGDGVGSGVKDRKRSAHWSDDDTTILLNHLLAHRDTGRTADNGFKPEIWREAAALLDRASAGLDTDHHASSSTDAAAAAAAAAAANMGGPKTPEACKSRWQRLQRDFRAVKEMEEVKGFEFDRSTWRLKASSDDWAKAEKNITDAAKFQKIYLPHYDSLAILCSNETARSRVRTKPRVSFAAAADSEGPAMIPGGGGSSQGHPQSAGSRGGGPDRGVENQQDRQPAVGLDLSLSVNGSRSGPHTDQAHLPQMQTTTAVGMPPGAVWHDHAGPSGIPDYNGFALDQSYLVQGDKAYTGYGDSMQHGQHHRQVQLHSGESSQKNDSDRPSPPKRPRGISRQLSGGSQRHQQQQPHHQHQASHGHEPAVGMSIHTPLHGTQSLEPTPLHSPLITTTRNALFHPGLVGSPELHTGIMDQSIIQSPDGSFFISNTVRPGPGQEYGHAHHPSQGMVPGGFSLDQPSQHQHQQHPPQQQQQGQAVIADVTGDPGAGEVSSSRRSTRRDRASKTQSRASVHHAHPPSQQDQVGQSIQAVGYGQISASVPPQHSPRQTLVASHPPTPGQSSTTSIAASLPAIPPDMSSGGGQGLSSHAALAAASMADVVPPLPPPPATRTRHGRKQSSANAMTATHQPVQQTAPPSSAIQPRTDTVPPSAPTPSAAPHPGTMVIVAPHGPPIPGQPLVFPVPPSSSSSSSSQHVIKSPSLRVSVDGTPLHEVSPSYFPPFGGFGLSPIPQHGLAGTTPISVLPGASPVVLRPEHLRRTDALMRLQAQETEMHDEDLVEVMAEFETNVAAADTYLAIQKEGLRKMWLLKLVARRRGVV